MTHCLRPFIVADTNFIKNTLGDTTAYPNAGGVGIRQWTWQTCSQCALAGEGRE